MQFLYYQNPFTQTLSIEGESFKYLSKIRRIQVGETIQLCNLKDQTLYRYIVIQIDKKTITLSLQSSQKVEQKRTFLQIGWCVVDPKIIEKTLPFLNELGVGKITFIYCARSQRNFKLNFERMKRILINSCQQCGRVDLMELQSCASIERFVRDNPKSYLCDFGGEKLINQKIETIIVGPEGGLSECERNLNLPKIGFETPLILRSETAVTAIASKILI